MLWKLRSIFLAATSFPAEMRTLGHSDTNPYCYPPSNDIALCYDSNTMTPNFLATGSSRQIRMFKYVNQPSTYVALLPIHYKQVLLASPNIWILAHCCQAHNKLTIIRLRVDSATLSEVPENKWGVGMWNVTKRHHVNTEQCSKFLKLVFHRLRAEDCWN